MLALALALLTGHLTRLFLLQFSRYELPLTSTDLIPVILYLFLIQGLAQELAKHLAARLHAHFAPPPASRRRLLIWPALFLTAFAVGTTLDPSVHLFYVHRPHRLVLTVLIHLLISAPWMAALVTGQPTRRLMLQSAWRLGLISVLDREAGFASAVLALFLLQLARDAFRAWRPVLLECS